MTVFKLVSLFRGEILGQYKFLDDCTLPDRLGQFSLKNRPDVFQVEFARKPLSDLFHMGVHASVAAFADITQHAIDMDGVDVETFRA